jgi:hypothetical protein
MATWERRDLTRHVTQFIVPAVPPYGAVQAEITTAIQAAAQNAKDARELNKDATISDLRFLPGDNEIIIEFEITVPVK